MTWRDFRKALDDGTLRSLPDLNPFGQVLSDTLQSLGKVWQRQKQQRDEAAREARERAAALRHRQAQMAYASMIVSDASSSDAERQKANVWLQDAIRRA